VAYTFNRAKDPANQFTGNTPGFVFSSIGFESAEALDDRRVQINIARKNPIAFGLIAEVYIHCKDSYEAMSLDEAAANPIGSGPYQLASWTRGSEVVLEKVGNPNSPANMQRIVWRIIPEASTRSAELIAGNVDIITNVAPDQIDAVNASGNGRGAGGAGHAADVRGLQPLRRVRGPAGRRRDPGPGGAPRPPVRGRRARDLLAASQLRMRARDGHREPAQRQPQHRALSLRPGDGRATPGRGRLAPSADGNRFAIKLQAGQGRYLNDRNVVLAIAQYLEDVGSMSRSSSWNGPRSTCR
jgi:peptide/nickel transport system substrate-binding protein